MCRAGGGGREDGVASAGAEGCWVGESCQREVIQAGNDVRSPPSAWPATLVSVVLGTPGGSRVQTTPHCQHLYVKHRQMRDMRTVQ